MRKSLFTFITILCSFSVDATMQWSAPPLVISNAGINASSPQVAMDPNGNAIAIWIEEGYVKSSYLPFGGNWSSPLSTLSGFGASQAQVVMDGSGNATAIWVENGSIQASTKLLGQSWSSNPSTLASSGSSSPQIAADANGDIVAVWISNGFVESSTKLSGGNWSLIPTVLSITGGKAPQVAIGGGNVIAVWDAPTILSGLTINEVYAASTSIGGTWETPQAISSSSNNAAIAQIAVDSSGNGVAVWFSYNVSGSMYSNVIVQTSSLPLNGAWTTPQSISPAGMTNPADLIASVGFDSDGNALAIWIQSYDGNTFDIETVTKWVGGSWQPLVQIVNMDPYAWTYDISITSIPDCFGVYMGSKGGISIFSVDKDTASTTGIWTYPVVISNNLYNAYPSIGAVANNNVINAVALFESWDGSNTTIEAVTGTKAVIQPPTNLSVVQTMNNFDVIVEYMNTLNWTLSISPVVIGYNIYRNGVLIKVLNNVSQFIDHNRTPGETIVYGVSSIDQNGNESVITTIGGP